MGCCLWLSSTGNTVFGGWIYLRRLRMPHSQRLCLGSRNPERTLWTRSSWICEIFGVTFPPIRFNPEVSGKTQEGTSGAGSRLPSVAFSSLVSSSVANVDPLSNDELTAAAAVGSLVLNPTLNKIYGCNGATMRLDRETLWKTDAFDCQLWNVQKRYEESGWLRIRFSFSSYLDIFFSIWIYFLYLSPSF